MLSSPPLRTFADVLRELGDVPIDRILADPPPGSATEDDLLALVDGDEKRLCELVDGTLVEKPMGSYEARLAALLIQLLGQHVRVRKLGFLLGADGMVRTAPRRVRLPDVSFYRRDRFPAGRLPAILPEVPDLAIEVVSPSNREAELAVKRSEYLAGGAGLIWEIDPKRRRVAIHAKDAPTRLLAESDSLDGGDVLPGFSLELKALFDELDDVGEE
jgi:Uma2 family endonuclease